MDYYILRHETTQAEFIDGDVTFCPALAHYYQVGKRPLAAGTHVRLVLDECVKKLTADFFLTTCGAFFVSAALKSVLEQHRQSLDFREADTRYFNGNLTENLYFLIHADRKQACFDYVNSHYSGKRMILARLADGTLAPDYNVRGIRQLCLDEDKTAAQDFFFVDQILWIDPVISGALMTAATNLGLELNVERLCQPLHNAP